MTAKPAGLYVHIPFCEVKCRFCDFAAYPGLRSEIPRYLKALDREMAAQSSTHQENTAIDTVYFGGGTPSILSATEFDQLMASVRSHFQIARQSGTQPEISIECNPETIDAAKLECYRQNGVNRISLGLQATQERLLKTLGRLHSFEKLKEVFALARQIGFNNINIDLMYGLPDQSMDDWKETLDQVLAVKPEHLSAYALSIEEKTAFSKSGVSKDNDLQAEMYEYLNQAMDKAGFSHYEISNFAKPGFESRHNLKYWRNENCLGIGVSAAGYMNGIRRKNTERVMEYLEAIETNQSPAIEETSLNAEDRIGEDLMLALRLKEGAEISAQAGELYGPVINKYLKLGYLTIAANRIHPTQKGWLLSNQMFQDLLTPPSDPSVDVDRLVGNGKTLR